jgi:zinc transporter 9
MPTSKTTGFLPTVTALIANVLVAISKFIAAATSGSSVMFSEAIHSTADTLNQLLLLVGLQRSTKKADATFEYGYGNERFFWALISACGVFFLGAGVTGYHGIESLLHPREIQFSWVVLATLIFSGLVEGYSFFVAASELRVRFSNLSVIERIKKADSATLAVYLEDSVAVFGVLVAVVSIGLSYSTGSIVWDGLGSLVVAGLLAFVGVMLIAKNRSYLLGQSMPPDLERAVLAMLQTDPSIERIIDFKSNVLGQDVYRIKFEIEFNGDSLARDVYGGVDMREQFDDVRGNFEDFKRFAAEYADRVPRLMGRKIDEIEQKIKKEFPSIRHIDIEIN